MNTTPLLDDAELMQECIRRRQQLLNQLSNNAVVFVAAAEPCLRNGDVEHAFRQDSHFYYLTGFTEPEAALLMRKGEDNTPETLLLCQPKNKQVETWEGKRLGVEAAPKALNIHMAKPINELESWLDNWLDGAEYVYYAQVREQVHSWVHQSAKRLYKRIRQGAKPPKFFTDVNALLDEMRLIKSPYEQAKLREACYISASAHCRLMQQCKAGMWEYQLAAQFAYDCSYAASQRLAYGSIVAGGNNACILHYQNNDQVLQEGDLVLIDAGCELDYYAADITRTFPVSGRFSDPQKAIYNLVLQALEAALAVIREGVPVNAMQEAAVQVITQGLVKLGILQGDVQALVESGAYKQFYMHNVGHWLGMDVHDVGQYKQQGTLDPQSDSKSKTDMPWRLFQAGMITTVEPGIYIAADTPNIDSKWLGIGVRIEDDILVTQTGHQNLTRHVPVSVEAIEALMQRSTLTQPLN